MAAYGAVTELTGARGALVSEEAISLHGDAIKADYDSDVDRTFANDREFGLNKDGQSLKL